MQTVTVKLPYKSRGDKFSIVFLGDLHFGTINTDEGLITQVVERIRKDPFCRWVDLGDSCEFINVKDKRFDVRTLPLWMQVADLADLAKAQVSRYGRAFKPIAGQCLARIKGNHEEAISRHFERDVYTELNEALDLPEDRALGMSGFLRLIFRRTRPNTRPDAFQLDCYLHHGSGGGKLAGSKAVNLERLPMSYDADVYVVGHTHTRLSLCKRRIGMNRLGNITERPLIMINVGSFGRGEREGYAERAGMYPQGLGACEMWIWPDSQEIKIVQ